MNKQFKKCPCCNTAWESQDDFLSDKLIKMVGYKVDFEKLEFGLFFFNHLKTDCKSTITIDVNQFLNLYKGTKYEGRKTGLEGCPGYCLKQDQLDRCDAICECAYVREIINIIREYPESGD